MPEYSEIIFCFVFVCVLECPNQHRFVYPLKKSAECIRMRCDTEKTKFFSRYMISLKRNVTSVIWHSFKLVLLKILLGTLLLDKHRALWGRE